MNVQETGLYIVLIVMEGVKWNVLIVMEVEELRVTVNNLGFLPVESKN
jgi:hypothetical protein